MAAMLQSRFFRICSGIILLLVIVFLTSKISFIFNPILTIFRILILPFMMAGFFYYLFRPLVNYLAKKHVNKIVSILLIYFLLTAMIVIFSMLVWPTLNKQIENFINGVPQLIMGFQEQFRHIQENQLASMFISDESELSAKLSEYLNQGITAASNYVTNAVALITNFIIIVATVPIILYYMLKDSKHIPTSIMNVVPRRYRRDSKEVMEEIDGALSGFIVGRVIITGLLGVMMYIGFLIIDLPYSLLLVVVATVLNIIPYIGALLGAVPVLIVAFIDSPSMVIWSLVVIVVAQQIEGNLLAPHIYGKQLDIHPLTTILLLLIAGDLAGILGVILAIPAYMVIKIIVVRCYRLFLAEKVEELIDE